MKKLILAFSLLAGLTAFGQNYATGDTELNNTLVSVNTAAKANIQDFKNRVVKTYGTDLNHVNSLFAGGMTAGDVVIAYEIAKVIKKPVNVVLSAWSKNKLTGWGVIAKNLGIKPGSAEFHQLKANTKSHSGGMKPGKSNGAGHGNSGTHGNGHGNGKK